MPWIRADWYEPDDGDKGGRPEIVVSDYNTWPQVRHDIEAKGVEWPVKLVTMMADPSQLHGLEIRGWRFGYVRYVDTRIWTAREAALVDTLNSRIRPLPDPS